MTDIEQKALALVNEVRKERGFEPDRYLDRDVVLVEEALCRAIEQHEAFRRAVSDALEAAKRVYGGHREAFDQLDRFIIAKPDPLAEAWIEATGNTVGMEPLNAAIEKRGGKIVWGDEA